MVTEGDADVSVVLGCERQAGTFGQVRVAWEIIGDHGDGEVMPSSGEVKCKTK